jgi:adenylate cyclase
MVGMGGTAWLGCIPVVVISLMQAPDTLDARVPIHLAVSIVVAGLIAITHGFFAIELASQSFLFPVLFGETQPSSTPGAYPLTFQGRWTAWAVSAGVCPIVSLLLLLFAPEPYQQRDLVFPSAVGLLAIVFGLTTAWMLGRFYAEPVRQLRSAAQRVSEGQLESRVDVLRADDFGPLIAEFNEMVKGLREKERIRETFGLHVGSEAAEQILARDPGLGGVEQRLTIMFVDIRNFTSSCRGRQPQEVVSILNEFLTEMVDVVQQQHGGMVNKYLGDGFMALFGAGDEGADHADSALRAGKGMLTQLGVLNERFQARSIAPLGIGIGIHTGEALVGSIGSERRLEFTAIGDSVNIASRVESLTKVIGASLLLTEATRDALTDRWHLVQFDAHAVKGVKDPLVTFTLGTNVDAP